MAAELRDADLEGDAVRVDGFWKIIPSERPGRTRCSSRGAALIRAAVSSTSSSSSREKSATRVKWRPLSVSGRSSTGRIVRRPLGVGGEELAEAAEAGEHAALDRSERDAEALGELRLVRPP